MRKEASYAIAVFDRAMKKFSEHGVDDSMVDRFHIAMSVVKMKSGNADE